MRRAGIFLRLDFLLNGRCPHTFPMEDPMKLLRLTLAAAALAAGVAACDASRLTAPEAARVPAAAPPAGPNTDQWMGNGG